MIDGPNRVGGIYPKNLPDLFKDQMVVLGRYEPGGKKGKITLEGTIRGKKKKPSNTGAVFPKKKEGNSFHPTFGQPAEWAIFG